MNDIEKRKLHRAVDRGVSDALPSFGNKARIMLRELILDAIEEAGFEFVGKQKEPTVAEIIQEVLVKQHPADYAKLASSRKCPACDHDMIDANDGNVLLSNPPQVRTRCTNCGLGGTRFL